MAQPSHDAGRPSALSLRSQLLVVAGLILLASIGAGLHLGGGGGAANAEVAQKKLSNFVPGDAQTEALGIAQVQIHDFRDEIITDGYIASGDGASAIGISRDAIARAGAPIPMGQSSDLLQAEADLGSASGQLTLAQANEARQGALYRTEGAALKDWQQSQADLAAASAAMESARARLRLLGRSEKDIARLEKASGKARMGPDAAPGASGKAGVWLVANIREEDVRVVRLGDKVAVAISALSGQTFTGSINYIASVIDPSTHRLLVGAVIPNANGILRPNMLATVTIEGGNLRRSPAVPRNAVIFDGDATRVWIKAESGKLEARSITLGQSSADLVEVTRGLAGGEKIISSGALFLDQEHSGG